jgi:hypothetical protein
MEKYPLDRGQLASGLPYITGELGRLAALGDTVQCHACGAWYRNLGLHAWWTHLLTADEYRTVFGLRRRTGLVGPSLSGSQRDNALRHLQRFGPAAAERLTSQTREQRSLQARGRRRPLESRLDPVNRQSWIDNSRRGGRRLRELWASGDRQRPRPARTALDKARARWLELLKDPAYRAEFGAKVSRARGKRVDVACATCGRPFALARYLARGDQRRFCSRQCLREFQRRRGFERGRELAARYRRTWKRCAHCGAAFDGTARQRYYGRACKLKARRRLAQSCPVCGASFEVGRVELRWFVASGDFGRLPTATVARHGVEDGQRLVPAGDG